MRTSNLIHGLTFDLAYDGGENGEVLAEWLREVLLPVVDETLEQHDQPQQVCRIERLEIDLGEILREDVEGELARRLHEKLSAVLNWSSAPAPVPAGASTAPPSGEESASQLLSFLRSGRLPWSVAADQQTAHEQLMRRVLQAPSAKSVLETAVSDQHMLTRLVRQFAPSTLLEVAQVLHGQRAMAPVEYSEADWLSLLVQGKLPSSGMLGEAFKRGEVARLAQIWSGTAVEARAEFRAQWLSLSDEIQRDYLKAITRYLTEEQLGELTVLIRPSAISPHMAGMPTKDNGAMSLPVAATRQARLEILSSANKAAPSNDMANIAMRRNAAEWNDGGDDMGTIDAEELAQIWSGSGIAEHAAFKAQWLLFAEDVQRDHLKALGRHLTEKQFNELTVVVRSSLNKAAQPSETTGIAPQSSAAGPTDDIVVPAAAPVSSRHGSDVSGIDIGEQAERQAGASAQPPVAARRQTTLSEALKQNDIDQLAHIWSSAGTAERAAFAAKWLLLGANAQRDYLEALDQRLTDRQLKELAAWIRLSASVAALPDRTPDTATRHDAASVPDDVVAATQQPSRQGDDIRGINVAEQAVRQGGAGVQSTVDAARQATLDEALKQNDIAQLAQIWSDAGVAEQEAFKARWIRLADDLHAGGRTGGLIGPASSSVPSSSLTASDMSALYVVEQALPQADAVQPPVAAPRQATLDEALKNNDIVQLAQIWSEAGIADRGAIKAHWPSLAEDVQRGRLEEFAQHLTEQQFNELTALIRASAKTDAQPRHTTEAVHQADAGMRSAVDAASQAKLDKALEQGDIVRLAQIWSDGRGAEREVFKTRWHRLAADVQYSHLEALGRHLTEKQLDELTVLVSSSTNKAAQPGQKTDIATRHNAADRTDGHVGSASASPRNGDDMSTIDLVEQALRQADTAASSPVAAPRRTTLDDALKQNDMPRLAQRWSGADTAEREMFKAQWLRLADDVQRSHLKALAQHLTARQLSELTDVALPSADKGAQPEMTDIATRQNAAGQTASQADAAMQPPIAAPIQITLHEALKRNDIAQFSQLWSVDGIAERAAFKAQWQCFSADARHGYLEALAGHLTAMQINELRESAPRPAIQVALPSGKTAIAKQRGVCSAADDAVVAVTPATQGQRDDVITIDMVEQALRHADAVQDPTATTRLLSEESELKQPDQRQTTHSQIDPALRMFRDWQRSKLELSRSKLTLAELKQWLNWWLMHDASLINQDCNLMLEAIETQCSQVNDPVLFMKLVLMALREGDALDLETLSLDAMRRPAATDQPVAVDAIATLTSQQAIRNFVAQQMAEDEQLSGLNSAQLHQLVRAWTGDAPSLFLTAIEDQALLANDMHLYFRSILQSLLDGLPVDLECLAEPAAVMRLTAAVAATAEHPPVEPSPLPPSLQQSLPQKLADALLRADLTPLKVIWPEIMRFHADVVLEAARRYLRRPQERANLAGQSDAEMVMAMVRAISPKVADQLEPLIAHADRCATVLPEPLPVDDFRKRVLTFAFDLALDGGQGAWLDGLMQVLAVGRSRANDVAHAWRAMLPPARALDAALFGERYRAGDAEATGPRALTVAARGDSEALLALLLMRSSAFSEMEQHAARLLLQRLLDSEGAALTGAMESALSQPAVIERLTGSAPGPMLAQLMVLLQPALAAQLPVALGAIASEVAVANVPAMQHNSMWRVIYQSAFVTADPVTPTEFIRTLVHSVSGRVDLPLPQAVVASTRTETLQTLLQPMKPTTPDTEPQQQEAPAWTGESNIRNAGMVIFATYMQRLFSILELTADGRFVSDDAAQRAIHLVQYAVSGESVTPEYQLVLNKLFCGIHGGLPIVSGIDITPKEKDVIEQMLNGVIAHWSALGKTSISGLRETFLQREGHLYFEEDAWHLRIQQATFDMLLDRLPWSFSMIKFPWMEYPLHVTWR